MKYRSLYLFGLLWGLMAMMSACSSRPADSRATVADSLPVITVSIEPQHWLLDRLGGDRVAVHTLMDKNADPENFDPTVAALRDVEQSTAYFCLGNNAFEEATLKRLRGSGSKLRVVNTSEGIELIEGTHGAAESVDPHTWQSVANMRVMARNMVAALNDIDPAGREYYAARLERLNSELDSLDAELRATTAQLPSRSFVVWHPSLSYFARDYSLKQIALGAEGKEITPAAMMQNIATASQSGARVMFLQPDDDAARSADIARRAGLVIAQMNIHDYDWPATMRSIAGSLRADR